MAERTVVNCDRCRAEIHVDGRRFRVMKTREFTKVQLSEIGVDDDRAPTLDLCGRCATILREWLDKTNTAHGPGPARGRPGWRPVCPHHVPCVICPSPHWERI